jgi:hypothetical protein
MRIKTILDITVICFLSLFFLANKCMALTTKPTEPPQPSLSKAMENDGMEWKGYESGQSKKLVKVIAGKEEWSELWGRAFHKSPPVVDFDKYAIACVFLGFDAPWLYGIEFGAPVIRGDKLIILYSLIEVRLELSGPFHASGQYHMKVFGKKKGYKMELEEAGYSEK